MNPKKRFVVAGLLVIIWGLCLSLIRAMSAPAVGAATVSQLNDTNSSYVAAVSATSVSSLAFIAVSVVFAGLIYRVLRSKK